MTKRTATLSIYMSAARKLPDSATCVEISNYLRRPYQRNDTKQLMRESTFSPNLKAGSPL